MVRSRNDGCLIQFISMVGILLAVAAIIVVGLIVEAFQGNSHVPTWSVGVDGVSRSAKVSLTSDGKFVDIIDRHGKPVLADGLRQVKLPAHYSTTAPRMPTLRVTVLGTGQVSCDVYADGQISVSSRASNRATCAAP